MIAQPVGAVDDIHDLNGQRVLLKPNRVTGFGAGWQATSAERRMPCRVFGGPVRFI